MHSLGLLDISNFIIDKSPAAYDSSSPPRPEAPRSSTPLIFPSMTSRTTLLESTDYPSHGLVSEEKEEEALIPGKWRGAKMMARMERNFVTDERGGSRTPESEHEDIGHQVQFERNNRRCFKRLEKSIQSTEVSLKQGRQKSLLIYELFYRSTYVSGRPECRTIRIWMIIIA